MKSTGINPKIPEGAVFGRLTVIKDEGCVAVQCLCACGVIRVLPRSRLTSGNTRSCGCLKSEKLHQKWKEHSEAVGPEVGTAFGRLTVVSVDRQYMVCRCSCGNEKRIFKYDVLKGKTASCGCLNSEVASENLRATATKHGGWGSREWNLWWNMHRRCEDPNAMGYENYGGRGIAVCHQWSGADGFKRFLEDLGRAPSSSHSLDRINTEGAYQAGNVRWATPKEQARNRRNNRMISAFGKTQCLAAWSEEVGLSPTTIRLRLQKGWGAEQALKRKL